MKSDDTCIFCKIIAGKIPCFKLHEDAATIAFMDVNPANPGHALAVVKEHWQNLFEIPAKQIAAVAQTAKRVATAVQTALAPAGINLAQANGPGAGQSVPHLHFHILPRAEGDDLKLNWGHNPGDMDAVKAVYEKVLAAM
ncbi:MAG TPA: HIT family protein [Alphaproteobacteria bacterium]|nr:HIT family protein [Alphaproteobacteria bacterium]